MGDGCRFQPLIFQGVFCGFVCVVFGLFFFLRWTNKWKGDVAFAFLCLFFRVFIEKVELWKSSKSKQGSQVWVSGTRIFMYNWNSKQPVLNGWKW